MNEKQKIGKIGEDIAAEYLKKLNYRIMERNFRCKRLEIDIIAEDKATKEIIIVEVKTRRTMAYGTPAEAVDRTKRIHLYVVASYYLYKKNLWGRKIRFDVIEILLKNNNYLINHLKNIEI